VHVQLEAGNGATVVVVGGATVVELVVELLFELPEYLKLPKRYYLNGI